MTTRPLVVRCPRCGSLRAESVEAFGEFDRMRCRSCGHEAACDGQQIKDDWNDSWPFSRPVDALATL
ncbi:MAG: hypothetical protein HOV80_17950, partial [Polyangiaceae bacterium]|nr:hypothetical protein [Polyangiaceae bacterium]